MSVRVSVCVVILLRLLEFTMLVIHRIKHHLWAVKRQESGIEVAILGYFLDELVARRFIDKNQG
jgi:hypothetical protein